MNAATASSSELFESFKHRDPGAAAELVRRFTSDVRRALWRVLGSGVDVDDLTQETFLISLTRLETLRRPDSLRSFVVSVAIRVARNEIKRRRVRRFVELQEQDEATLELDTVALERLGRLERVLNQLDDESRSLLLQRYFEGLRIEQIARRNGVSLTTLKRRLGNARRRFDAAVRGDAILRSYASDDLDEEKSEPVCSPEDTGLSSTSRV